jgi:hypothetical protein
MASISTIAPGFGSPNAPLAMAAGLAILDKIADAVIEASGRRDRHDEDRDCGPC